jgi:hypothetical protein
LPGETLLHGLPMASAVCRTPKIDKYMNTIDLSTPSASYIKEKIFVVLTNVFSTKIMVGARDRKKHTTQVNGKITTKIEKLPIKLKKNYNQINTKSTDRRFSNILPCDAHDLYLLDMQPHRRTLKYDKLNKNYNLFEYKKQDYSTI